MPELPEVETVAITLRRHAVGATITRVWASPHALRGGAAIDARLLRRQAVGRQLTGVTRRAKYLLLELSSEARLLVHLGMTGGLYVAVAATPRARHTHLVLGLDRGGHAAPEEELRFVDARRFGQVRLLRPGAAASELEGLGPDPLAPGFSVATLREALRGCGRDVKSALMDQHRLVGVGNIYASEALFLAGIRPTVPAQRLGPRRLQRLHRALREVLLTAIANGGTTLRDFADAHARPGAHRQALAVYHRAGEPCRVCGRPIRQVRLGQRSSFYCSRCQRG